MKTARYLGVALLFSWIAAAESTIKPVIEQWRDDNGVMHFSDRRDNAVGIKEHYAPAPTPRPTAVNLETRSRYFVSSARKNRDHTSRPVLSAECEWLRGRIAYLRRLTQNKPDSIFKAELTRRRGEWHKTQCQTGTHHWNRELLPTRKGRAPNKP